jgi:hypothetical protein
LFELLAEFNSQANAGAATLASNTTAANRRIMFTSSTWVRHHIALRLPAPQVTGKPGAQPVIA